MTRNVNREPKRVRAASTETLMESKDYAAGYPGSGDDSAPQRASNRSLRAYRVPNRYLYPEMA